MEFGEFKKRVEKNVNRSSMIEVDDMFLYKFWMAYQAIEELENEEKSIREKRKEI